MENKKWRFRYDFLGHYINDSSNMTFQDVENRLNYLEEKENQPDMREKVKEYISELDAEYDRCMKWYEKHIDDETCQVTVMEARMKTLNDVKNDLKGRLEELV